MDHDTFSHVSIILKNFIIVDTDSKKTTVSQPDEGPRLVSALTSVNPIIQTELTLLTLACLLFIA
jgi:hypothetical protein